MHTKIKYRILSFLVDFTIIVIMVGLVLFFSQFFEILKAVTSEEVNVDLNAYYLIKILFIGIISEIIIAGYLTIVPALMRGQTFGMFLFKTKIASFDGTAAPFASIFIRQTICLTLLPILTAGISLLVDLIVMNYRRDNLSLSDVISRSCIVDKLDY